MSFPRYESYKSSGIEWLGDVPRQWAITKVKHVLASMGSGGTPDTGNDEFWAEEEGIPWIAIGDMSDRDEVSETEKHLTPAGVSSKGLTVWPSGTLLFSMYASLGHVSVTTIPAATNQAILALVPRPNIDRSFLKRWFEFLRPTLKLQASSSTQDNLNAAKVANLTVAMPAYTEQIAIATFLDCETAKIDALVERQQRLIELLKEKRQAVISHAVTKGLHSNAPMKDTGIEWLGEVPAHWEVTRIKHISSHVVDCLHTTPTYDGYVEYPAVRTADVERGRLLLEQVRLVSRDVYQERIQRLAPIAGDILYSREGERFGMAALVPPGIDLCLGQRMMMFRVTPGMSSGYVMWTLNSEPIFQQVLARVAGATSPHVNISDIINFHLPNPPISEQIEIANFIERESSRLDALTGEAAKAITLLQERRSALISAAVMGKIDVRGLIETDAPIVDVVAA